MGRIIRKILLTVGKPFYYALEVIVLGLFYLIYFLAHLRSEFFKIKIKKGKKVKLPEIKVPLKLLVLKIRLIFARIFRPRKPIKIVLKIKFRWAILASLLTFLTLLFYFFILRGLPSPKSLDSLQIDVSTKIYDRNGVLLYKIYKNQNRTPITLSEIPLHVRLATLAAEDAEFYSHPGFSFKGIIRSLIENAKTGNLSGGSTITQQLVKNTLLSPEKTVSRKIKEIILAIRVESLFTKDQILEMYLNEVSYGGTAYGIKEGAQEYFSKEVNQLSLAEAAYLAGLIQSPTRLSPFGTNPDLAIARQKEVLHLMRINRFITADQEQTALNEKITLNPGNKNIKAPHFVMYVRQILVDRYGEDVVERGGLEVTTTLDYAIQQMAEGVVKNEIENLKTLRVGNGAALVLTPQTGEVLAMVGSKDYFDPEGGNVNVTLRNRQPGSSIKVVNYAYALTHGFTPASIIDDSPVTFAVPGSSPYSPVNYDGKFVGRITLRSALAQSRNVPAVKVLASYGVKNMLELGTKMGITTWTDPSRYGLSLTLGGGEVRLLDLAQVYATVANFGKRPEITPILEVKNYKGQILPFDSTQDKLAQGEQVLDPRAAFMLIDILKDNPARAPEFGSRSALVIGDHPEVAVKTGTSNDLKDNLTVGFNQKYLVAVWVGNNDGSPMSRVASGVTGASPIWNKIITSLLANEKSTDWVVPAGLIQIPCLGHLEWFFAETQTQKLCSPIPVTTTSPRPQILEPAIHTISH